MYTHPSLHSMQTPICFQCMVVGFQKNGSLLRIFETRMDRSTQLRDEQERLSQVHLHALSLLPQSCHHPEPSALGLQLSSKLSHQGGIPSWCTDKLDGGALGEPAMTIIKCVSIGRASNDHSQQSAVRLSSHPFPGNPSFSSPPHKSSADFQDSATRHLERRSGSKDWSGKC